MLFRSCELVGPLTTIPDALAVEFGDLDVEELLGLMNGRLLVRGLEALCVGLALEETAHLPISAGVAFEDSQFGRIVGNGRDCGQDGKSAMPCWKELAVICRYFPLVCVHKYSLISYQCPGQPSGHV